MKLIYRICAAFLAAAVSVSAWSCSDKKPAGESTGSSAVTESSTAAEDTTVTTDAAAAVTSAAGTAEQTTASTASETAPAAVTTTTTAVPEEKSKPLKGYSSSFEAAKAYYNAYLSGNPDAVYEMFCEDEIEGYNAYIGTTDLLEGKSPQVAFKRSNVVNAIKESIATIHGIMKERSDLPPDKWTVSLTEDLLRKSGENELRDFNKTLGTSFSDANDCGHVYYKDGNEEHDFIGNGCAFVELDGRWYLSYSTVMNAELITYLDI